MIFLNSLMSAPKILIFVLVVDYYPNVSLAYKLS